MTVRVGRSWRAGAGALALAAACAANAAPASADDFWSRALALGGAGGADARAAQTQTALTQTAQTQTAQAEARFAFDIPAQPLPAALDAFSRATGWQIGYESALAEGKSSPGVRGRHGPAEALSLLLAGTGLRYRLGSADSATLEAAAASGDGTLRLAPVMVTGEKTVRSLQDTATSVSVLTAEDLEERPGISTLDQTYDLMPNVVDVGTGNFAPTIRGADATGPANGVFAFLGGTRPRVTVQQDGRPLTFDELVYGRTGLWDVERVEVLRGPQTTLQGRNSIAGAIIVETKDPTFEPEAKVRMLGGTYETRQFSGAVSAPLVEDQLAFRIAADRREQNSWVDVTGDVGVEDPEEEHLTNLRGKLLFLPDAVPELTAKLTLEHLETRRPQTEFVTAPFEERENDGSATFPLFENQTDSAVLDLAYEVAPGLEVRATSTYSNVASHRLTSPGSGIAEVHADEFSNELVAEYDGSRLHGLAGAYYFASTRDETIDIGNGVFDDETRTAALFGEGTVTFLERWDVTLGGRYEREHRERTGSAAIYTIDLDETYEAFLPKFGLAYRPDERLTLGATVQRGWNAGGAGVAFVPPFPSYTYDPEYVWNYELYFRSSLLDDRLSVHGNLFYADYEDQQRLAYLDPADINSGVIRNAESSRTYGAELGANWLPFAGLELFGSLGLLSTKIEEYSASALDLEGNEFARSPNVTASFGATYLHDSGFTAGFDGRYVGAYFSDDDNVTAEEVDAHVLFDARLGYQTDGVRLFAFVNNILGSDAELLVFDGTAQLVEPREFGVGLEISF